ncbi:MAG: hypothetical protein ACREEM_51330 [Blastocatellia bacterium]
MPKMKLTPKQIATKGIWMMLGGAGMFAFSSLIFLTQGRQLETGFLSGVLNGLFLSGILLVPIGFIAFVYGLVSGKKTNPIFILIKCAICGKELLDSGLSKKIDNILVSPICIDCYRQSSNDAWHIDKEQMTNEVDKQQLLAKEEAQMSDSQPPYSSPKDYSSPSGYPLPPRKLGPVKQVPTVAILMIVQGSLECLLGLPILVVGPFAMLGQLDRRAANPPPEFMGVIFVGLGLLLLAAAGLHIYAGVKNYKYRNRTLGIVALSVGALSIFTCYCAPTAIGLLIYGLVVYLNEDVRRAFEIGEKGATPDAILRAFLG